MEVKEPKKAGISKTAVVVIVVAVVGSAGLFLGLYYGGYLTSTQFSGNVMHFTIYEADPPNQYAGMNGSYWFYQDHPISSIFPVITVPKGTMVVIQIINNASSEPHGFAIEHYFNSGTTVRPHESYTLTFIANQVGTFTIYCNVFCSIHPFMQNGQLNVTSS